MKQVFQTVAIAVVAVAALLLVSGLVLPREWDVEKSILIHADAAHIHPFVDDLQQWSKWAHTTHPDPSLEVTFSGPEHGVGAARHYRGQRAGTGTTTIVRADAQEGVWFESRINSDTPNADGSVKYETRGSSTNVTWRDHGSLPFIIGGFMRDSVERGLDAHMEQGLTRLKDLAEGRTPDPEDRPLPQ